ncbi:MAG: ABC transporter ATP-binding protein [Candidatus Atribacteria bacterium]|nr:ABC transporter ATP-binding protein [Candidatus Atribacteria bacterium]MCK4308800.1 ABC transporter ATP-binding protein [Candidatus Atribacteria bacterium]
MPNEQILKTSKLTKHFGNLIAVNQVDLEIQKEEIVGLIGPNGAGKTTFFNLITGLEIPDEGQVIFKRIDITFMSPYKICKLGISRTFQVTRSFAGMSVEEVIRVGAYNRREEREVQEKVDWMIKFFELEDIRDYKCSDLGLASLRKVEVARAAATEPDLLLLDEVGAGLTTTELFRLMSELKRLNAETKITLCVVEHVMQMVMGLCERIFVMDAGELIAKGVPSEISNNQRVIEAYLGRRSYSESSSTG